MKEKDEGLLRVVQAIIESINTAGATGGDAAKRSSLEWAIKATNAADSGGQTRARKETRAEAKEDGYKASSSNTLEQRKNSLHASVVHVQSEGRAVPRYLQSHVDRPLTVSAARLVERITTAPNSLQADPNFLLREANKAYWGTNWMELTFDQAHEVRTVIQGVYQEAFNHAATIAGNEHILAIRDKDALFEFIDNRPDIYRTEKLPPPEGADAEALDAHRRLVTELTQGQRRIDIVSDGSQSPARRIKALEDFLEKITETAVSSSNGSVDDAEPYVQRINALLDQETRLVESTHQAPEARSSRRRESPDPFSDEDPMEDAYKTRKQSTQSLSAEEQGELIRGIHSSSLKEAAEEIFRTPDQIAPEEFYRLNEKLNALNPINEYRTQLGAQGRLKSENVIKVLDADMQSVIALKRYLRRKIIDISRETPARSYWYDSDKHVSIQKVVNTRLKNGLTGLEDAYEKIDFSDLDEVFFDILKDADYRPQSPFAEAFNIFKQSDLEGFYGLLERTLQRIHAENPNLLSQKDIQLIVEEYTKMYELKEVHHNLIFMLEGSSGEAREMVAKYLGSYKDESADFMFKRIKGVKFALSLQEAVLEKIAADHDGRIPPYTMDKVHGDSTWTKTYYKLFSELIESANARGPDGRFLHEELAQLRGMQEWQKKIAIEMAYGFSIANMQLPMKLSRFIGGRGYTSTVGEPLRYDPIRTLLKFQIPKPGVAVLYMILTGDREGMQRINNSPKHIDTFLELYYGASKNEDTIAGLRNFLDISSRFGPSSGWGSNNATSNWTQEQKAHQGFAFDIRDARSAVERQYQDRFNRQFAHLSNAKKQEAIRKAQWGEEANVQRDTRVIVRQALERAADKVPLVIARRWIDDKTFTNVIGVTNTTDVRNRRFDLIQDVVRRIQGEHEVQRILFGHQGGGLTVHSTDFPGGNIDGGVLGALTVHDFKDLWVANPGNREIAHEDQHLPGHEKVQVDAAWKRLMEKVDILEGDLEKVQQKALARIQREIDMGVPIQDRLLESDYQIIQDEQRRQMAKLYAEEIKRVSEEEGHFDRASERIVKRKERYLISTVDVPWDKYEYVRMGGRGFVRAYLDANAVMAGGKGIAPFLEAVSVSHPKWEEALAILKKEVYNNIAQYYDGNAQEASWTMLNGALNIFSENKAVTLSGPLGDVWEKWDAISDFLEKHGFHRLQASLSKVIIAHDAMSMGPNEKRRVIRMGDGISLFAKSAIPMGWGAGEGYTARAMEEVQNATVQNVLQEIFAYTPLLIPIMLGYGIKEALEDDKKS